MWLLLPSQQAPLLHEHLVNLAVVMAVVMTTYDILDYNS
jgi:hypothetical protein